MALFLIAPARAAGIDAQKILDKVDDLYRGSSSQGVFTMTIKTQHWERELKLEEWSKGKEKSLIRILSPKKEKGTATLKDGKELWNYLPKVNRVIKLPGSMMGDSWMGSHFTNDDLVKESRMAEDYTFKVTFSGKRGGQEIIEVTCLPNADAAVVWGKVVVAVRASDFIPTDILYYDEKMKLARTLSFDKIKDMDGRTIPTRMKMTPQDKPKEYTMVEYNEIDFDVKLDDKIFSIRNLKK